jgi:hypothetical protein
MTTTELADSTERTMSAVDTAGTLVGCMEEGGR